MGFWSIAGPIIAGIGSDLIAGNSAQAAQRRANRQNILLQREQQQWEEKMSGSSWQRGTKDMLAAGLNPMLAYSQGGASTPNVSAATVAPEDGMARAIHSAGAKAFQALQLENMSEQNKLIRANTRNVDAQTQNLGGTATTIATTNQKLESELHILAEQYKKAQAEYDITEEQLKQQRLNTKQLEAMQPLLLRYQELVNDGLKLGMTQKEIDEKFAREMGDSAKYIQFIRMIFGR